MTWFYSSQPLEYLVPILWWTCAGLVLFGAIVILWGFVVTENERRSTIVMIFGSVLISLGALFGIAAIISQMHFHRENQTQTGAHYVSVVQERYGVEITPEGAIASGLVSKRPWQQHRDLLGNKKTPKPVAIAATTPQGDEKTVLVWLFVDDLGHAELMSKNPDGSFSTLTLGAEIAE